MTNYLQQKIEQYNQIQTCWLVGYTKAHPKSTTSQSAPARCILVAYVNTQPKIDIGDERGKGIQNIYRRHTPNDGHVLDAHEK
jgi:hypothetical protein